MAEMADNEAFHFTSDTFSIRGQRIPYCFPAGMLAVHFNGIPFRFAEGDASISLDQFRWSLKELIACSEKNTISNHPQTLDELVEQFLTFKSIRSDESLDGASYSGACYLDNLIVFARRWTSWGVIPDGMAMTQVLSCKIQDARSVADQFSQFVDTLLAP